MDIKPFHGSPKKVQRNHVKKQVHAIAMDKTTGQKTVILFMASDTDGVKDEPAEKSFVLPGHKTDSDSNNDDDGGMIPDK